MWRDRLIARLEKQSHFFFIEKTGGYQEGARQWRQLRLAYQIDTTDDTKSPIGRSSRKPDKGKTVLAFIKVKNWKLRQIKKRKGEGSERAISDGKKQQKTKDATQGKGGAETSREKNTHTTEQIRRTWRASQPKKAQPQKE